MGIFLLPIFCFAQQNLVDSTLIILKQQLSDTARAHNMINLAKFTEKLDIGKSHKLYKDAVDFALKHNMYYWAGRALRSEAAPYQQASQRDLQGTTIFKSIEYLEKDQSGTMQQNELGRAFVDLGSYHRAINNADSAIKYTLKGAALLEQDPRGDLTTTYLNLASIYQQMHIPEKQQEYADKALAAAKKNPLPKNLFGGYLWQVQYQVEVKKFDVAERYLDSARNYFSETFPFSLNYAYYALSGVTNQQLEKYDKAIAYYDSGYQYSSQNNYPWGMVEPKIQIAHIYNIQKKWEEADTVAREAVKLAEAGDYKLFMKEGYALISGINESLGNYKVANEYCWKYTDLKDTIDANERKTYALELEKKYETEKKDQQLRLQRAELKQQSTYNYVLLGCGLALLLIAALFYRNYRNKQKLQQQRITELETQQQLTATEAVLKGEEKERTRLAKDLHDGLGGMLSGIKFSLNTVKENLVMTPDNAQAFDRSIDMLDSSIKEMRRVAHNMMPEGLVKFGLDSALNDFCADINQSGALNIRYQSIGLAGSVINDLTSIGIYRIVQELVNNVIKHAAAKNVLVQVSKSNDAIFITVEDDGKGFDKKILEQTKGIGWTNIENRVEFLKGKLDVQSAPGQGTAVLIELKS